MSSKQRKFFNHKDTKATKINFFSHRFAQIYTQRVQFCKLNPDVFSPFFRLSVFSFFCLSIFLFFCLSASLHFISPLSSNPVFAVETSHQQQHHRRDESPNYFSKTWFESHSQTNSDSYFYNGVFLSKKFVPTVITVISIVNKYDINDGEIDNTIFGMGFTKILSKRAVILSSYSFSNTSYSGSDNRIKRDDDRLLFLLNYKMQTRKRGLSIDYIPSFSTQTDWATGVILAHKFKFSCPSSKYLFWNFSYQYNYNLNLSDHTLDVWNTDLTYQLSRKGKMNLTYLFIDNLTAGSDDDNIWQLGYTREH